MNIKGTIMDINMKLSLLKRRDNKRKVKKSLKKNKIKRLGINLMQL